MGTKGRWMIYGANGFTGALLAEHAVARGHRPVLAGRSRDRVAPLADRLGLEHAVFVLDDPAVVERALRGHDVVFAAAGPFTRTSEPLIGAALAAGVNYLDITGEIPVFQNTFRHHAHARDRGVCLVSGVGFDVVPTDCLAKHVAEQLPGATRMEIAIAAGASVSAGTMKSALEQLPKGNFVRRGGKLESAPVAHEVRRVRFYDEERGVASMPLGDLETAYRSTGIGDITTFIAQSPRVARVLRFTASALGRAVAVPAIMKIAQAALVKRVTGPDAGARQHGRCHVWARASDRSGASREGWLETAEAYAFTARAGVRAVERVLELRPKGALTPALAFGADFVLEMEGSARYDRL